MELPENVEQYLSQAFLMQIAVSALKLLAVLILAFIALKMAKLAMNRWKKSVLAKNSESDTPDPEKDKRLETITSLLQKGINIGITGIALLIGLQTIGVAIGPILASAGVLGLAVGFGAQNLVKDVISGFFIIFEDQIRQGDIAVINGQAGTVEKINFRTIVLRDASGSVHYFPNGSISRVTNMTKGWSAMVFDIGVAYKEDLNKVMGVMKDTFESLKSDEENGKKILEDIEIFGLDQFGDSALIVKARIKTIPLAQWAIGRAYRKLLKEAFDQHGIEIPFPHQSIYFGEASAPFKINQEDKEEA